MKVLDLSLSIRLALNSIFDETGSGFNEVRFANFDWKPASYNWPDNAAFIYAFADTDLRPYIENYTKAQKNFRLDGREAIKTVAQDYSKEGEEMPHISVVTIKDNAYYHLEISPFSNINEELFDQIIATFKFIK